MRNVSYRFTGAKDVKLAPSTWKHQYLEAQCLECRALRSRPDREALNRTDDD